MRSNSLKFQSKRSLSGSLYLNIFLLIKSAFCLLLYQLMQSFSFSKLLLFSRTIATHHSLFVYLHFSPLPALFGSRYFFVKGIFGFTHFMVMFCILWFLLGHIFIYKSTTVFGQRNSSCTTNVSQVSIVILIFEYMIGIWYLCCRIWNSSAVLSWLQQMIRRRMDEFSNGNHCFYILKAKNPYSSSRTYVIIVLKEDSKPH